MVEARRTWRMALLLALVLAACGRGGSITAPVPPVRAAPIIAREALFGDAARSEAALSPGGDLIAFIAPRDGAMNLWIVSRAGLGRARPLTAESGDGVADYRWAADGRRLLYYVGSSLWTVDALTGDSRALFEDGRAEIVGLAPSDPGGALVAITPSGQSFPELYRIDLASGARTLIEQNARRFFRYVADRDNHPRLGLKTTPEGDVEVWTKTPQGDWRTLLTIPFEDAPSTTPLGFDATGRDFFMLDSTGRDRAGLVRIDAATGVKTVLGESARADVVDIWQDPASGQPEAFAADYLRREWRALDAEAQADLAFLDAQLEGEPRVTSRSLNDRYWIVMEDAPTRAPRTYLYDRSDPAARKLTLLFRNRPALDAAPLQPTIPVEIEARDGLTLVSYLTLPIGSDANGDSRPDQPTPLVVLPHAGPWSRDSFGFEALHQWLANRGYAVLSVNFRGSTGFGKAFLNAGNREWGGKMQDDLLDAVQWAVEEGVAQPERVAVLGEGYGGFAALHALAFTPQRFACGIDLAGPSNLELAPAPREEWARPNFYRRVGDARTPEGRQALHDASPLTRAGDVARPLLIVHGARDTAVARAESDQMAAAIRARRTGLVYLAYPEAGDVLASTRTRLSVFAAADQFLSQCLGGRAEPLGAAFEGVRAQTIYGGDRIDGLARVAPPPPAPEPAVEEETPKPVLSPAPPPPEATPMIDTPADAPFSH